MTHPSWAAPLHPGLSPHHRDLPGVPHCPSLLCLCWPAALPVRTRVTALQMPVQNPSSPRSPHTDTDSAKTRQGPCLTAPDSRDQVSRNPFAGGGSCVKRNQAVGDGRGVAAMGPLIRFPHGHVIGPVAPSPTRTALTQHPGHQSDPCPLLTKRLLSCHLPPAPPTESDLPAPHRNFYLFSLLQLCGHPLTNLGK